MHLEAQIVGVVEKPSGWTRIETDSRPQFLDTKREDLIAEARQLMREGVVAIIEYTERDGRNINPNTGLPYKDRYYEGARTASNGRQRDAEPEHREPEPEQRREREPEPRATAYGYRTHPESAWRMALTSGSERAVQTLPLMPTEERTFEVQKQIALAWAIWITNTPQPDSYDDAPPEDDIPY